MPKEFDLAGMASVSGWLRLKHKRVNIPEGTPCANCSTVLQGPFCHVCGQFAEDFHRSIFSLIFDFLESFFHIDGRVWRTMPNLIFRPGRLTRDYLNGKRVPQIPPFRLFLLILLLVFFVGHFVRSENASHGSDPLGFIKEIPKVQTKDVPSSDLELMLDKQMAEKLPKAKNLQEEVTKANAEVKKSLSFPIQTADSASKWFRERVEAIQRDPERFLLILEIWAYRVAVLALPIMAMLLTLLFVFQRRFYVYDHLVFSVHSLTFHMLLLAIILSLTLLIGASAWWLALASPFHVWFHMRKVYSSGVFGTLTRMALLGIGMLTGFALLAVIWLLLGFRAMGNV